MIQVVNIWTRFKRFRTWSNSRNLWTRYWTSGLYRNRVLLGQM